MSCERTSISGSSCSKISICIDVDFVGVLDLEFNGETGVLGVGLGFELGPTLGFGDKKSIIVRLRPDILLKKNDALPV